MLKAIIFPTLLLMSFEAFSMGSKRMKVDPPDRARAKYVFYFGIDGLGGHNLEHKSLKGKLPNITALRENSAWSHKAFIDLHALSGPNWSGMQTANRSSKHGIHTNECENGNGLTTIFDQIKTHAPELTTGIVTNWPMVRCYSKPGSIDFYEEGGKDIVIAQKAIELIKEKRPNFLFTYFGDVDTAGHSSKGNAPLYNEAVIKADKALGMVMETIKEEGLLEDSLIILTSDHGHGIVAGGHSWGLAPVPLYFSHKDIKKGKMRWRMRPSKQIRIHLVAPVSAYFLGLPDAPEWHYSSKALHPYILR